MDHFSATQLCESSKSLSELSQTQTPDGDKKKQIGTLKISNIDYPVYIGINTVGRHNSNHIVIKDASVSKHHAEIEGRKRSCFVTDLKSLNGTFDQFKEKYLENKSYMLMNGSTIKFGQIEATFRHFRSDGNVIRTPVSAKIHRLVASTPQSAVNSTHDDSSVVYGTQAAQANSSPSSSKFVVPKNLQNEFSKAEDDLFSHVLSNDIPTTSFKNIDEEPTQAFIVKKCSKSSENPNIVPESDSESDCDHENEISGGDKIFELETQPVASSINKNTSSFQNHSKTLVTDDEDDIFKQKTQIAEKKLLPKVENKNISIDSSNIHDIHDNATQVFSTKSNDIHEVKTQAFLSPSTRVPLKSKALANLEDFDTDEEGIFEGSTQKVKENLDNIHEAITQASSKSKDNEDSETDEEGLFNEPTQKVSTKSDNIHEQITQVIPSSLLKLDEAKNITSNITTEVSTESNRELSDHDDNIQKTTNQVFSKPDNIHENETQAFSDVNKITHEDYSAIFESEDIDFEGQTQKFPQKVRNLHEDATQVFEKNKIHEDKTQVFLSLSTRKLPGTSKAVLKEDSRNLETEETDFEGPTQKFPNKVRNLHEDATQVYSSKSENIHESKTQAFPSPSARKFEEKSKDQEKERNEDSRDLEADEIDFEGPTQKLPERLDNIHEDATQVFSTKSANIHEDKTQAFPSPSARQLHETSTDLDEQNEDSRNLEDDDDIDFDGPTQKMPERNDNIHEDSTEVFSRKSENIHESKTQVFPSPSARKFDKKAEDQEEERNEDSRDLEADDIDFEGPTQKLPERLDNIHENETQVFSTNSANIHESKTQIIPSSSGPKLLKSALKTYTRNSMKKHSSAFESNEIDFDGETQKISDNIHQDETELFSNSDKRGKILETEEIDYEGPTQKLVTKSVRIDEAATQFIEGYQSEKEDSDTDEEGIFENSKEDGKTEEIHEANTQLCDKSEKDESGTDEEGVFENSKEVSEKSAALEANTQLCDKSEKHESDTDEEGIFDNSKEDGQKSVEVEENTEISRKSEKDDSDTDEEGVFENSKEVSEKSAALEANTQLCDKSEKHESDTDEEGIFDNSKEDGQKSVEVEENTEISRKSEKDDSDTDEEGVFEGLTDEKSTKNPETKALENTTKIENSSTAETRNENASKLDDSKILLAENSKEPEIEASSVSGEKEKEEENGKEKEEPTSIDSKKATPTTKRRNKIQQSTIDSPSASTVSKKKKPVPESKTNTTDISENKTKNSDIFAMPVVAEQDTSKNTSNDSDFTGFSPRRSRRSTVIHEKVENFIQKCKKTSPSKSKTKTELKSTDNSESKFSETSENENSKQHETSDAEVEGIFKNKKDSKETKSKRNIQKNSPIPSTSKQVESEMKNDTDTSSGKQKRKPASQSSTREQKLSKTVEKETSPRKSLRLEKSLKNDNEPAEEKIESPKKSDLEEKKKKTWKFILPLSVDDPQQKETTTTTSSQENYEMNSRLASVENLEYETSATQPMEASQYEPTTSRGRESVTRSPKVNVVGNHSPRMSQLNIQVERPLKKRALRTNDNEKHDETLIPVKNKRAKQDENSPEGAISKSTRSKIVFNPSPEQLAGTSRKAEETIKVPANPRTRRGKNSSKLEDTSSSSIAEDSPAPTNNLKIPQNPRSRRTKRTNSPKNQIINSSTSMTDDSEDTSITKKSRSKRTKTNTTAESSMKDSTNASKEKVVNPRISRRGKIPTASPSTSLTDSKVDESMKTDPNSSVASSSKTNFENTTLNSSKTKELAKVNPRRGRVRKMVNAEEIINASSSNSISEKTLNETTSSISLEKTIITEPKKTRGRKTKTPNQSLNQENLSASSSIPSQADSDLNSSSASTSSRAKRSRQSSPLKHKVLFTGIPVNNYQKQLTKLGLNETDDVNKCTILVTDKVRRTFKFLCAVSRGIPVLSVKWITDSTKKSSIQDLDNYIINDPTAESKFNFNLKDSLKKARERKMLEGYTIILTPNINAPPVAELKEMVTASGGKAALRPPAKWQKDTIIVSNDQDRENAIKFMAKAPNTVSLHSTEFLLTGILKQEVDLESYLLKLT